MSTAATLRDSGPELAATDIAAANGSPTDPNNQHAIRNTTTTLDSDSESDMSDADADDDDSDYTPDGTANIPESTSNALVAATTSSALAAVMKTTEISSSDEENGLPYTNKSDAQLTASASRTQATVDDILSKYASYDHDKLLAENKLKADFGDDVNIQQIVALVGIDSLAKMDKFAKHARAYVKASRAKRDAKQRTIRHEAAITQKQNELSRRANRRALAAESAALRRRATLKAAGDDKRARLVAARRKMAEDSD